MGFQPTQDFNSGLYVWKFNSLGFLPKIVSDILSLLPFSSLIYTPVMIIVGKYDASQILQALLLQFFLAYSDGGLVSVDLETSPVIYHHSGRLG